MLRKNNRSLFSKILHPLKTKKTEPEKELPKVENMKETYILRADKDGCNFIMSDCCHPIPGDDVMGWVNDNKNVELHTLTCPRAQVLKASYGKRIINTMWASQTGTFLANVKIEGIDRFGILQEIIQLISNTMSINIRKLNIEAEKEVFHCDLSVLVNDTNVVTALCTKLKSVKGVQRASRVN
jgi:GTP pyrophosphokinase